MALRRLEGQGAGAVMPLSSAHSLLSLPGSTVPLSEEVPSPHWFPGPPGVPGHALPST
jgi:hypothetical protein